MGGGAVGGGSRSGEVAERVRIDSDGRWRAGGYQRCAALHRAKRAAVVAPARLFVTPEKPSVVRCRFVGVGAPAGGRRPRSDRRREPERLHLNQIPLPPRVLDEVDGELAVRWDVSGDAMRGSPQTDEESIAPRSVKIM